MIVPIRVHARLSCKKQLTTENTENPEENERITQFGPITPWVPGFELPNLYISPCSPWFEYRF